MGSGINQARKDAPEHAELMDDFKDQLLIAFLKRMGGKVSIPVAEADDTSQDLLSFCVDTNLVFHFKLSKKS